ncbi:MAG: hypothetical protein E7041_05565 [Lentisphaerae bacterium]|nr:hypothetical protein [Lentisphaerota bacterium]
MGKTAFLLILLSVFLHAGWNFLSKANRPSKAFFVLANGTVALLTIPFVFIVPVAWGELGWKFWLLLAGSVAFEVIYAIGLAGAYKKQDISIAYPLARALPVLMVALVTLLFGLGAVPEWTAWTGFAVVALGCIILPQSSFGNLKWREFVKSVSGFILLAALGTTGYTVVDKVATAQLMKVAAASKISELGLYLFLMETGVALALLILVLFSGRERVELFRKNLKSPAPYLCGLFSGAAYFLVLAAMGFVDNVSFLQAFRQMSLPVGVILGVVFLHEKLTLPKIIGTVMIVLGLILTVF